jgi:nucleotide-binding universal stress UspA family protein
MDKHDKILIAVNDTEPSRKAVTYVGRLMRGRPDAHVRLFHVLPPTPPEVLESGGTEDPNREERLSAELRRARLQWTEQAERAVRPSLEAASQILVKHGLDARHITTAFSASIHKPDVGREVIEEAVRWDCATIVVGRHALPWMKEMFYRHVGEELLQHAQGFAVWVVE